MLPNLDDDARRCPRVRLTRFTDAQLAACNDASDNVVDVPRDLAHMAAIRVRAWAGAPAAARVLAAFNLGPSDNTDSESLDANIPNVDEHQHPIDQRTIETLNFQGRAAYRQQWRAALRGPGIGVVQADDAAKLRRHVLRDPSGATPCWGAS